MYHERDNLDNRESWNLNNCSNYYDFNISLLNNRNKINRHFAKIYLQIIFPLKQGIWYQFVYHSRLFVWKEKKVICYYDYINILLLLLLLLS